MNPVPGPELRDIHVPPPPSWWPPAPGWWIVAILSCALIAFVSLYLYKKMQRRRRRLALLSEFEREVAETTDDLIVLASALSAFLRRVALKNSPSAAALSGEEWLRHLDASSESNEFTGGIGRVLIEAPFRAASSFDASALTALVRRYARKVAADV
jgi:Domain of unknown function (DUF4381)